MKLKTILALLVIISTSALLNAQVTKDLNKLIPMHLVDSRSKINKTIMGIGASVHITIAAGMKYVDACSKESTGNLKIEINWYNENDETGKVMLQMMKDMNGAEQEKESFLKQSKQGKTENLAGGILKMETSKKECRDAITGPTGEWEYSTDAWFFSFKDNRILKIVFTDKIKPETANKIIANIAAETAKFNFSVYSSANAHEIE